MSTRTRWLLALGFWLCIFGMVQVVDYLHNGHHWW